MTLSERIEVITACLLVPLALEVLPGDRVLRAIRSLPPRERSTAKPTSLARAVDRGLHFLPGWWRWTCLRRAATLAALLRRHGLAAEVLIGVRRSSDGSLLAHAWLACGGDEPYLERGDAESFTSLRTHTRAAS